MNNDQHQARIDAEQDAEADVVKFLWVVVGFFINLIGVLIAYIYQPTPPAMRLFEKSHEYTMFYTESYKAKARNIQLTYAAVGFVISAGLGIIIIIGMMSMIGSVSKMPY
jgi:phage shock protein PspC (stress-responsive transcriptional regulator)